MNLDQKLLEEHKEKVYVFVYHAWLWTFSLGFVLGLMINVVKSPGAPIGGLFGFLVVILFSSIIGILAGIPFLLLFRISAYLSFQFELSVKNRFWSLFLVGIGLLVLECVFISFRYGLVFNTFHQTGLPWFLLSLVAVFLVFTWKMRYFFFFDYIDLDPNSDNNDILDAPLNNF